MAAALAQRDPWAIFPDAPAQVSDPTQLPAAANDPWDQFPDADAPASPAAQSVAAAPASLASQVADVAQGTAEVPLTMVSGAMAQPASGLAGLAAMATKALGLTDADPADVVRKAQELLTYKPTSESGKGAMQLVSKPFESFAAGAETLGDKTFEATGSPLLATAARTAPDAALALLGARGAPKSSPALRPSAGSADLAGAAPKGGIPEAVGSRVPEQVKAAQTPVEVARAAGYKLKPSEAGGKKGAVAEGLSGAAKLERDLVMDNQQLTHKLVSEELGLPADTQRFTPSVLNKAKAPHNAVYDEVGTKLGDWQASPEFVKNLDSALPTRGATAKVKEQVSNLIEQFNRPAWNGKDAIQEVRKLRQSSTKRIRSDDPDVQSYGYAERRVADAIEDEMTRQAQFIGEPDLMARLASARESLAKIHTIDAARTGTEVSVPKLVAQAKKGKPLSGRLKLIADVGAEFPTVMRTTAGMKDKVPVNMTETIVSGGLSALGHKLAAGATFLARPATRAILKSDAYQNRLAPQASKLGPNSPLGDYFASKAPRTEAAPAPQEPVGPSIEFQPTAPQANRPAPEALLQAQKLAGDLQLQPEPVPNAVQLPQASARLGDLVAETPAPIRGDLPFTPQQTEIQRIASSLADELGLAPEIKGEGLTFTPSQPRAAGMADNVPGTTLYPELRAVRDRSLPSGDELTIQPKTQEKAARSIRSLAKEAVADTQNQKHTTVAYGTDIHPDALTAFEEGGVDVSGYTHVVDNYAIRHAFKQHGDVAKEQARGQVALTHEDFAALPEIVGNPDSVTYVGKTKQGRAAVQYAKQIGDTLYMVEEARTGRKQLAVTSMWKVARHEPMPGVKTPSQVLTPQTLGGVPPAEKIPGTRKSTTTGEHIELRGSKAKRHKVRIEHIEPGGGA